MITQEAMRGMAMRYYTLTTHYRAPINWQQAQLESMGKKVRRLLAAAKPSSGPVPRSVMDALKDDLNTPKALAEMDRLAKADPEALYAAMKLMGFLPEGSARIYAANGGKPIPLSEIPIPWS